MMLNWKTMTLGQHARVLVTSDARTREHATGTIVIKKSAVVDARWDGSALRIFGHGSLWAEILESAVMPARFPEVDDGVFSCSYADHPDGARKALQDFESCVRAMMRLPGWTVVEQPL